MSFSASEIVTVANCTWESQYFQFTLHFFYVFTHATEFLFDLKLC
jgi:hypothetical protein